MSQQPQMQMSGMAGGPVGGGGGQPVVAGTSSNGAGGGYDTTTSLKRLNTAIYDYMLRNSMYDSARAFIKQADIEAVNDKSPHQGGRQNAQQQPNGVDESSMDVDSKEVRDRPDDLPAPKQIGEGGFLQDWWCQFWEIYFGVRQKGKLAPSTMTYIGTQRQAQKTRTNMMAGMDPVSMQTMRSYNGMMPAMTNDLKRAALQRNMNPAQIAQMQNKLAAQQNAQAMQGQQMERQGSQMDMGGPRSGSPGSGDAPSPKRQRLDGGAQQMQPGRPGPPGQMQTNPVGPPDPFPITATATATAPAHHPDSVLPAHTQELLRQKGIDPSQIPPQQLATLSMQPANHQLKAVELYSQSLKQSMTAAMHSNMSKGMHPNAVAVAAMGGAQGHGSPMPQGMDAGTTDFYPATNGRMGAMPANSVGAAGQASGNHALQEYQIQLMLLEQQNKKRLLMARQEQDTLTHQGAIPGQNGQFAPGMSPQGSRAGDPSPNPSDMQRGTPKIGKAGMSPNGDLAGRGSPQPGMMHPNIPPEVRAQLMAQAQGGPMMLRGPSSNPTQMTTEQQMRLMQQHAAGMQMSNGAWQGPQGQMLPGQQPGQSGQPGQPPMGVQRQPNLPMPPPPVPPAANASQQAGTQPSSPSQPAAPPTPAHPSKAKLGTKEAKKKNAAANKKGGGTAAQTPATESEAPPTSTPATPITPMHPTMSMNPNAPTKNMPNGQPANAPPQNPPPNQLNAQQNPGGNPPVQPAQQPAVQDVSAPFGGGLDANDQFGVNIEFATLDGSDVLDNFDFDSFLNPDANDLNFDANFPFADTGLDAGGELTQS